MPPLSFKQISYWLSASLYHRFQLKGIDFESTELISEELKTLLVDIYNTEDGKPNFSAFDHSNLLEIVDFLSISHTYYKEKLIPELEQSIASFIIKNQGKKNVWLEISLYFNEYKTKLLQHIEEEETVVFPILKRCFELWENNKTIESGLLWQELMTHNHDAVEEELAEIIEIIKKYHDQDYEGMSISVFLSQISRLEHELRNHALIEDLLLMPLANKLFI